MVAVRSKVVSILAVLALTMAITSAAQVASVQQEEASRRAPFLGAWIHVHALFNPNDSREKKEESIARSIENCRRSGLKSVIPFALNSSGDACYPSSIVPKKAYGDWDPLGVIIREARSRGLQVYIAVPTLVCGHKEPKGILIEHPEWALQGQEGKILGYMSGANPDVRQWIVSVIQEIVRKYQPEGIILDYLRFPNQVSDVDPESRKLFLSESGLSDYDPSDHKDSPWQKFKESSLVDLAGLIRKGVDEVDPKVELGLYTWGPHVAKNHYVAQDWPSMVEKGYITLVNVSGYLYKGNYGDNFLDEFDKRLKQSIALLPTGKDAIRLAFVLGVITSHGKVESEGEIEAYLHHARAVGVEGISVFTLSYLEPFIDDLLKKGPFDTPR